jgi:hypothetical protein
LTNINIFVALPGDNKSPGGTVLALASGTIIEYAGTANATYYSDGSDGSNNCGIYIYAVTNSGNQYNIQGGTNSSMTYTKIA